MTNSTNKPTTVFWVIGIIALIWNLMGVMAYLGQAFMTDEMKALLPEAERAMYENNPAWYTAAFAIAVFGGALACILLLMKKKLASTVFIISFLGVLVQMYYSFFVSGITDNYGPGEMVMPIMIIVLGAFLIWYSKDATKKGWLS